MKSDKTEPQQRSMSSTITTTGLLSFSSPYHDAKIDMSAGCSKTKREYKHAQLTKLCK